MIQLLLDNDANPHQVETEMARGVDIIPCHTALQWPAAALALLISTDIPFDVNELALKLACGILATSMARLRAVISVVTSHDTSLWRIKVKIVWMHGALACICGLALNKAVRDHPKGCRLKLLAKLLSFEGSKIDVNKRAHLVTGQRSRV